MQRTVASPPETQNGSGLPRSRPDLTRRASRNLSLLHTLLPCALLLAILIFEMAADQTFDERPTQLILGIAGLVLVAVTCFRQIFAVLDHQRYRRHRLYMEETLQESERRFRAIFDQAPLGVAQSDLNGYWVLANDRLLDMYGYTRDELLALRFTDITHPDDLAADLWQYERLLAGEIDSYRVEKRFVRKDGSILCGDIAVSLVRDQAGAPCYTLAFVSDIRTRKEAQLALARSEEHYRSVVEASMDGIIVQSLGGIITFANAQAAQLLGYPDADALVGRRVLDVIAPEDSAHAVRENKKLIAHGYYTAAEFTLIRKDGSRFTAEIVGSSMQNAQGAPVALTGIFRDITARREAELALAASEERYRRLFAENPQPLWVFDRLSLRFLEVNEAAVAHYGYSRDEFLAMTIADIRPEEDVCRLTADVHESVPGLRGSKEWRHRTKDGRVIDVAVTAHSTTWVDRGAVLILALDITEQKHAEEQLRYQALHDPLTGLPNRVFLEERLQQALLDSGRDGEAIALLLMDIHDFKEINDTFGHHFGDLALDYLATCIRSAVRHSDTVARVDGDEFAVILPGVGEATAAVVAGKLRKALEQPFEFEGRRLHLVLSIGVALAADGTIDGTELLRRADVAMYTAKRTDEEFAVYQEENDRRSPAQAALLADFHDAVRQGDLFLHYQPKVDSRTGSLVGVEALVRWHHPEHGMIPPNVFIDMAERTGLIKPLTISVLDQALCQCRLWHENGLEIKVAVNLSAQSLHDPDLDMMIAERIKRWDVSPSWLTLEVTESAIMSNPDRAMGLLVRLRDMGITLSIDDFGTGYSSLAYLKRLPVSEVKIDRSFVTDMLEDQNSAPIVRSIVELGHSLGLSVVAEGAEDEETLALLRGIGCDVLQGFGLCRPVSSTALEEWLQGNRVLSRTAPTGNVRILVIEDNAAYLKLVRTLLTSEGFEVHTAVDAESALFALERMSPHLVLTDVNLPGVDGLELARLIRSSPAARKAVIVALTGRTNVADEIRARAVGCDRYTIKPESTRDLLTLVHQHAGAPDQIVTTGVHHGQ
jgi:diguanylate cyclase (GGDEF)-like protein/PAS domain S-box-containing protein